MTHEALQKLDEYALNLKDGIDRLPVNDISKKLQAEVVELKTKLQYSNEKSTQLIEGLLTSMHNNIMSSINKLDFERPAVQPENTGINNQELIDQITRQQEMMKNDIKTVLAENMIG